MQEVVLYCPFCEKQTIKALHRAAYTGFKTARGSGVSNSFSKFHEEEYVILSGCSSCGKPEKEVRAKMGFKK